jgi:hypothetical protein
MADTTESSAQARKRKAADELSSHAYFKKTDARTRADSLAEEFAWGKNGDHHGASGGRDALAKLRMDPSLQMLTRLQHDEMVGLEFQVTMGKRYEYAIRSLAR